MATGGQYRDGVCPYPLAGGAYADDGGAYEGAEPYDGGGGLYGAAGAPY